MLILSDKLLLDIQLMHTFTPNMIHKPWMVSTGQKGFQNKCLGTYILCVFLALDKFYNCKENYDMM